MFIHGPLECQHCHYPRSYNNVQRLIKILKLTAQNLKLNTYEDDGSTQTIS